MNEISEIICKHVPSKIIAYVKKPDISWFQYNFYDYILDTTVDRCNHSYTQTGFILKQAFF